jgi:hypothetical protein
MERWINVGEFNNRDARNKKYSKYRYALEAITPKGLYWCENCASVKTALNIASCYRQDWTYRVYDTYLGKVVK